MKKEREECLLLVVVIIWSFFCSKFLVEFLVNCFKRIQLCLEESYGIFYSRTAFKILNLHPYYREIY